MENFDLLSKFTEPTVCATDAARTRAAKAWAARLLARVIASRHLTQKAAAMQAQTSQTRISNIKNGVLHATRLEMILLYLENLGASVTVDRHPAGIHVAWAIDGHETAEHFQF